MTRISPRPSISSFPNRRTACTEADVPGCQQAIASDLRRGFRQRGTRSTGRPLNIKYLASRDSILTVLTMLGSREFGKALSHGASASRSFKRGESAGCKPRSAIYPIIYRRRCMVVCRCTDGVLCQRRTDELQSHLSLLPCNPAEQTSRIWTSV
jgi:hypothetical protein